MKTCDGMYGSCKLVLLSPILCIYLNLIFPSISSLIGTWPVSHSTVSLNYSTTIKYIQNLAIEL
jgi:hypothetical protein